MTRVTVSVDDSILSKIDEEAHKRGISRSQCVSEAIESYVTDVKQGQIEVHNLELELNKSQTEVMQLNRKISKIENQLAEKDKALESKGKEVMNLDERVKQLENNLLIAQKDTEKSESMIKAKDDDIAFLRATIHQLTEKITPALPPSQEEAKRKRWYQFWRRGRP